MKNLRLIFMGTPIFSVPVFEYLIENTNVIGVVTQPDKDNKKSPIKIIAEKNNIKIFQPIKIRKEFQEVLNEKPDIIVTCAYGQIIPKEILACPKYGCINVHASILPNLRGGAPIHRAILNGYTETGITIMFMDEGMDTGDIISFEKIMIGETENVGSLHDRLSFLGRDLLEKTLPNIINNNINRVKQNNEEATYAYNIKREDEKIDWNDSTYNIYNKIRGLNPWPGSYSFLDGKICKIWEASKLIGNYPGNIGEIIDIKDGIRVKTNDGIILIESLQLEGKRKMNYKEFTNGRNIVGMYFN